MARPLGFVSLCLAFAAATIGATLAVGPAIAPAQPAAAASPAPDGAAAQDEAKDAGSVEGQVTAIDYRASTMTIDAGGKSIDVTILPSTNIEGGGDDFHSVADIKKGQRLRVLMSKRGATYSAQIITLL